MQRLQGVKYSKGMREECMRMGRIHSKRSGRNVMGWGKYSVSYVEGITITRRNVGEVEGMLEGEKGTTSRSDALGVGGI
jgi:hypothetical protein